VATIVSISMPAELRKALDAQAEREQRSRSFVVAEAVREYLASCDRDAFEETRLRTLREGLALDPAARLRLAEELLHEFARGSRDFQPWAATFRTFDEYERWKREGGQP
jgi:predicted transcriptional regulator